MMSINSLNHDEIADMANKWEMSDKRPLEKPIRSESIKSAEARRRIEVIKEIKESGLTIEEARELGLLH